MNVSTYPPSELSGKRAVAALPKVNVRPRIMPVSSAETDTPENGTPLPTERAKRNAALLRRKDWDVRFAALLILLVVGVNVTLALLLSGDGSSTEEAAITMDSPSEEISRKGAPGDTRSTNVYVSSEDKRLLLRHLSAPAPEVRQAPLARLEQHPSLSHERERALSLIGGGMSAGK